MSDVLTLEDGRMWWASNRLWHSVLKRISESAVALQPSHPLGPWLVALVEHGMNGASGFDLRGLSDDERALFWNAASDGLAHYRRQGERWTDAQAFAVAVEHFELLLRMHASVVAGEAPEALNTSTVVAEWDGEVIDVTDLWFVPPAES